LINTDFFGGASNDFERLGQGPFRLPTLEPFWPRPIRTMSLYSPVFQGQGRPHWPRLLLIFSLSFSCLHQSVEVSRYFLSYIDKQFRTRTFPQYIALCLPVCHPAVHWPSDRPPHFHLFNTGHTRKSSCTSGIFNCKHSFQFALRKCQLWAPVRTTRENVQMPSMTTTMKGGEEIGGECCLSQKNTGILLPNES